LFNNTSNYEKINLTTGEYMPGVQARAGGAPNGELPARALSNAHIRPFVEFHEGSSILRSSRAAEMQAVGGGKRSSIKGFSRNSRLRLMYMIGAIRRDAELPDFVTLTYPETFPSVERAKRDLKVFLQRFKRAFPEAGAIWKLEPQQRGAPHYHLLVWGCKTNDLQKWTVENWYDIAGQGDINHYLFHAGALKGSRSCVSKVRSWRGVWSYASKYLGKTFDVAEWGQTWTGRFWGVIGRTFIPFGAKRQIMLPIRVVVDIMRFQRRFSGIRSRRTFVNSLTTFCDVDQWVEKLSLDLRSPP